MVEGGPISTDMNMNISRYYPVPPLPASSPAPNISSLDVGSISELAAQCWAHYEHDDVEASSSSQHTARRRHREHRHSLYLGSLGPCAYLRYRLAKSLSWSNDRDDKCRLLFDASTAVEHVLSCHPLQRNMRITLLEGERVGALALFAAIHSSLEFIEGTTSTQKLSDSKSELLDIGTRLVQNLSESECEVLYGRAGYLHAIALVRSETGDVEFGRPLVEQIVRVIIKEGERNAQAARTRSDVGGTLSLLWKWHNKAYLGAIHGVVGILYTLLCFIDEVSTIEGAIHKIKMTLAALNGMCYSSSDNLRSSIGSERDELVHLCHGAPGHILCLVKAYEVTLEACYLERAYEIARSVICRRGLLKKGVGLCHGISGNAYCFLAVYRGLKHLEERMRNVFIVAESNVICRDSDEWLHWAHHFAKFGMDHIDELCGVPDHPYSMYEGMCGLIMLLQDLKDPMNAYLPVSKTIWEKCW